MNRCLLGLLSLASLTAAAEESLSTEQVRVHLHEYYRGERLSGFVPFVGSGVGSLAGGALLVTGGTEVGRGAGWVNLGFGALEVLAGLYFAFSSYGKERALDELLLSDPKAFAASERARVARITDRFQPILLGVEAALSVGGGVLAGVGGLRRDELMLGVGLGFAVQGLVMFLLDWAVLDRAAAYGRTLSMFKP